MIMELIKRDGRKAEFNSEKIVKAISKAFAEVDIEECDIPQIIAEEIEQNYTEVKTVEDIQNDVERKLMRYEPDVAKAYILYREERRKVRLQKDNLIATVRNKVGAKVIENSNANVDESSFSGRKKEASDEVQKELALSYGMSKKFADAHIDGYIYQHDLSEYEVGSHNCLHLDFEKILNEGFATRNSDVRPPSNLSTACQLMAVAFQCQSQVQ